MSILTTTVTKQPLKLIEVPLNKFNEEVIPHHQRIYEEHRVLVLKLFSQNDVPSLRREIKNEKRMIKQLKDLMYELETLRARVEDTDLDKFDVKTLSLRKIIINLISGYGALEKRNNALALNNDDQEKINKETSPFDGAQQIQLHQGLDEIKLTQQQELLNHVEGVNRDVQDINDIFGQLNEMVVDQHETTDKVEQEVDSAHANVNFGLKQLIKAHKLKATAYPVTGAFLGSMIGGPVGFVAGFKIGGLAALGCAIAGYAGGKFFKNTHKEEVQLETCQISGDNVSQNNPDKKDK